MKLQEHEVEVLLESMNRLREKHSDSNIAFDTESGKIVVTPPLEELFVDG